MSPPESTRGVSVAWQGLHLELFAERSLFWPEGRTLFVSDLHLGKEYVLGTGGVSLPRGPTEDDLARLGANVAGVGAERLVVLGDFWHGPASWTAEVLEALAAWRSSLADVEVLLVRGNHDRPVGDPPPHLGIDAVDGPMPLGPFILRHEPSGTTEGIELAGHVHPVVRLRGAGRARATLPCFWFSDRGVVLPSFGRLTGGLRVAPAIGDRVFVVGPDDVVEVPVGRRSGVGRENVGPGA